MSSSGFMAFEISSKAHGHRAMGQGLVRVYSPMVTVGGHCWRLACYPYGDAPRVPALTRFASVYLELVSHPTHAVTATFDAFAVHGDGSSPPSHHNQCVHVYSPDHRGLRRSGGFPEFIPVDTQFNVNDITVMWRVTVARDASLSNQLGRLLDRDAWTDVSFVVAGETFRAHRALLAARSPVFEAELFGAMLESSSSSSSPIALEDIEPETFGAVLRFIYTDTLPDDADGEPPDTEALGRLLAAADRFALDGLKLECTHRLLRTVSVGTVVDMLRLAGTHSCAELKAGCIGFIAMIQNFKDVVLTDGFVQLAVESPTILAELRERTDYFA
ncbi:BTB/POZ and MATH domain-containing protein 1-like [Triticum dicoccoides]|uniref:BTB/POZ and MATH domain-containing protein 1-like n=1 Tax=Triticum dicoccoides TaxID=85692 RepID=UPI001890CF81|nr:BTB/POZ and MATH domain-containing protein 1-like [Triticum dicoccoides]